MQWALEDIYKKQVRGKIPPRKHLRVVGENSTGAFPGMPSEKEQIRKQFPEFFQMVFGGKKIDS